MKPLYLYLSVLFLFSLGACKKEYPALPYTDILAFSVKDANDAPLKAVIENNEIILYWPVGQPVPEEITPSITVADKASVLPVSDAKVSFNESVSYTVTAEDGTKTTYKLKPVVNSFIPLIKAFYGLRIYNSKSFLTTESSAQLGGDLFDVTEGKTKVFFVNTSGNDIPVAIDEITPIAIILKPNVTIGNYQGIKVVSGNKSSLFRETFEVVTDPFPALLPTAFSSALTIKRSAQFTLTGGKNLDKISGVSLYNRSTRAFVAVNLKATTANSMTLEIPANFPLGICDRIKVTYPASNYYAAGSSDSYFDDLPITVTE